MKRIYIIQHPSGKYLVGDESPQAIAEDRLHAHVYSIEQVSQFQLASDATFIVTEANPRELGTFYGRIGGSKVTPAKCEANRQRQIARHKKAREAKRLKFEAEQKTRRSFVARYGTKV